MKNIKEFLLESKNGDFDSFLKKYKDNFISFEDFEKQLKEKYPTLDICKVNYDNNKSITVYYSLDYKLDLMMCLSIELYPGSTKDSFKIKSWDYEKI